MTRRDAASAPIRAHFSGHETFPLRQMWLKKAYDQALEGGRVPKATFTDDDAIATFGVGKNMVASIRHWALACGVLHEDQGDFRVGELAGEILHDGGFDPYAENPSTAWLAHWQLAGRCSGRSSWLRCKPRQRISPSGTRLWRWVAMAR